MSTSGSVWNPANIRDVSESLGLNSLPLEVIDHLTRDVEFRIAQVLEEALKFMRHSRRTTLHTTDVSLALRSLDVEPLYGYESTRPLRFGEASIGPGQNLFYLEDEELDFEKLINAPLPKVPREMTFSAHWLAVEGVQPSIPQNPTTADTQTRTEAGLSLLPKSGPGGAGNAQYLSATAGADAASPAVKPLVKHILSRELTLYFETVTSALLDATSATQNPSQQGEDSFRLAALNSLRSDPGLHQLVPYFVQFVAEKVTHNLKSLFVLGQVLGLVQALLENKNLHLAPYVSALVPPVLTCLIGRRLGSSTQTMQAQQDPTLNGIGSGINGNTTPHPHQSKTPLPAHYPLRALASSILQTLTRPSFIAATPTLKPRLARTLLKHLLSPTAQPLGVYYGAIKGLTHLAGVEGVRVLLVPNVRDALGGVLQEAIAGSRAGEEMEEESESEREKRSLRRREADEVISALLEAFDVLARDDAIASAVGGDGMDVDAEDSGVREKLVEKLGEVVGGRVADTGDAAMARAVLAADRDLGLGLGQSE